MCAPKAPKVKDTTEASKPVVIRNTYLDGLDPEARAARSGRSALKIDLGSSAGSSTGTTTNTSTSALGRLKIGMRTAA